MEALKNNTINPIRQLEIITDMLPDHNPVKVNGSDGYLELEVDHGLAFTEGLKKCDRVAVARTVISDGGTFTSHYHQEKEVVVIYEGGLLVWRNVKAGEDFESEQPEEYSTGDVIVFESNVPHAARAIGKTRLIAITVPASKHFPDESKR